MTKSLLRSLLRCVSILLAATGITGCVIGKLLPGSYFDGPYLEAARAIKARDAARLRSAAQGIDVNLPGKQNMTLLWFAIQEKNFEAIKVLVELGAKPDEQTAKGIGSAIDYAMFNKDTRFLEAMLDGGLPVDHGRNENYTLLHRAAGPDGATIEHVKLLVERGADVNARSKLNSTPLHEAVYSVRPDFALYLVTMGADVNTFQTNGVSVMWSVHNAINRQQPGEMRSKFEALRDLMISKGAKYPPDPPEQVRARAKSQGIRVVE